jgi:broad specificity phosphatase PhoE
VYLVAPARDADVAVVSHVSPIKAAVAWALGSGVEMAWRSHLSQASICRIEMRSTGPVLTAFNETA